MSYVFLAKFAVINVSAFASWTSEPLTYLGFNEVCVIIHKAFNVFPPNLSLYSKPSFSEFL